mmetsp:Transcript_33778/g.60341  ORF Transcript_33778/g.60341 Transcript_33778/m.60341 type:complete len:147 (+) Transcript_33778:217-657(+)
MESELSEALTEVEALLAAEPDNSEVRQVYDDLLEAMAAAREGGGDQDRAKGEAAEEANPVTAAESHLVEDDRPTHLPDHIGDASKMYLERVEEGPPKKKKKGGNNARIHPRSIYADAKPNFSALAMHYPGLNAHMHVDKVCFRPTC